MKISNYFLLISGIAFFVSCESRLTIRDANGAMGQTEAPVSKSLKLSESQLAVANEGRLGLTETIISSNERRTIPVQWEISKSDKNSQAVILLPSGDPGPRRLEWSELQMKPKSVMHVNQDHKSGQMILSEEGKPVLQYNYETVYERDAIDTLAANKYITTKSDTFMANPSIYAVARSNYIHPLYGPGGEILTRDWSKDHPHHRGIYWAWPEVDFGSKRGDLHALQIVFARPTGKIKLQSGPVFAQIEAENLWMWKNTIPIVREVAVIRAYRSTSKGRIIDLAFRFIALKDSVTIARRGTHQYGGLNVRMQTPKNQHISFTTDSSNLKPRHTWSDLSGLFAGADATSGLMVIQHQKNPDYPGDWIQYPELSWVQPTFPASGTRYKLIPGKPLILRFRLFIHSGSQPDKALSVLLWDAFNSELAPLPTFSFPETEPAK